MVASTFIGIDWGTSRLRALLCNFDDEDEVGSNLIAGPGIAQVQGSVPETLFAAIEPWTRSMGDIPIIMAGMVGSNLGWRTVPYLSCPAGPDDLRRNCFKFEERGHDISIVPGVSCENPYGQPDLMRGEELQILGWIELDTRHRNGEYLLCLPGTHTKWVMIVDGYIQSFLTALNGELFSLLHRHSVLLPEPTGDSNSHHFHAGAFCEGLALACIDHASILHTLFSTRSRQISGSLTTTTASDYLSGLLIGSDISGALACFAPWKGPVTIIGSQDLCVQFEYALEYFGVESTKIDGTAAIVSGFRSFYEAGQ